MAWAGIISIDFLYAVASLILVSLGLAVIFGMMRIINLAHGEFLVLGSYAAILSSHAGVNIWVACLIVAPLAVGMIGFVIERLLIRHLYGRLVDTMLATWGLSLFVVGLLTTVFGNDTQGVSAPLGPIHIGDYQASGYSLFVIGLALVVLAAVYGVLRFTRFGLFARGTMQNADMAAALGVHVSAVYSTTFALGAGLAGLAGGVLAPVTGVFPSIGGAYIGKAFITVLSGGSAILAGTSSASVLLGAVDQIGTFATNAVFGQVGLLVAAVVLIRFMPQGITSRFFRRSL
ncbi:MAG TPA: branched-chain amino acid ABC transporter permease [Hyphomicrobiales bacterium]|nr:branched-chain amino acid ABC transporter permease [Hyphomicrobiales bacterium]